MERIYTFDFNKILACIGVITLHTAHYLPSYIFNYYSLLLSCAVPYFFMTSGYFLCTASNITLKKQLHKILKLYLLGFILYGGFYIAKNGFDSITISLKNLLLIIFWNSTPWNGTLWYIAAIISLLILKIYILNKCSNKLTIRIGIILILITSIFILMDNFNIYNISKYNFFIQGLPCFLWGQICMHNPHILMSKKYIYTFTITSIILILLNISISALNINSQVYNTNFTSLIICTTIFMYSLKVNLKNNILIHISKWGAMYTGYIYLFVSYTHGICIKLGIESLFLKSPTLFIFSFTVIFTICIYPLLTKIKF